MFKGIKKVIAAAEVLCYVHNVSIFDWGIDGKYIVIEGADENGLSFEMDIRITRQAAQSGGCACEDKNPGKPEG